MRFIEKHRRLIVMNAISAAMFVFGPQQAAAQSTWQKITGTAANAHNVLGAARELKDTRAQKKRGVSVVADMPSANQVDDSAQGRACSPASKKITSLNKNPVWTGVLLQLQPGFRKRGWCYVVPEEADETTYTFGLTGSREGSGSAGGWVNGFGPGGSTNRGGSETTVWYNIHLDIYKPNGGTVGSAEVRVPVSASDYRQFFGSTGGASYNRYENNQTDDADAIAIRKALNTFFR